MSLNKPLSSQFELFPSSQKKNAGVQRSAAVFKSLTLSLENIIVMSIVFVVSMVLFYSLGFARGKKELVQAGGPAEHTAAAADNYDIIVQPLTKEASADKPQPVAKEEVKKDKVEVMEIPLDQKKVERHFTIQVASFKTKSSAEQEAKTLLKKGHEAEVLQKGSYSIVCVGRFAERQEAKAYTDKLRSHYKDLLVRRL